jgi:hypothetical protein
MDGGRLAPMRRVSASRPIAQVGTEPSNPLGPIRRRFGDAAAFARIERAPRRALRTRALRGAATFSSGKTEIVVNRKLRRRLRVRGVRRARSRREGNSDAQARKNAKSAGAASNPLISLETAKENVWNSLEKAWKSLEFPWKSLDFPWKGLEKFDLIYGDRRWTAPLR